MTPFLIALGDRARYSARKLLADFIAKNDAPQIIVAGALALEPPILREFHEPHFLQFGGSYFSTNWRYPDRVREYIHYAYEQSIPGTPVHLSVLFGAAFSTLTLHSGLPFPISFQSIAEIASKAIRNQGLVLGGLTDRPDVLHAVARNLHYYARKDEFFLFAQVGRGYPAFENWTSDSRFFEPREHERLRVEIFRFMRHFGDTFADHPYAASESPPPDAAPNESPSPDAAPSERPPPDAAPSESPSPAASPLEWREGEAEIERQVGDGESKDDQQQQQHEQSSNDIAGGQQQALRDIGVPAPYPTSSRIPEAPQSWASEQEFVPKSRLLRDEERHISLTFEEVDERRLLDLDEGLRVDTVYKLFVGLDAETDQRLRGEARPLTKHVEEEIVLKVAVLSRSPNTLHFSETLGNLFWSTDGSVQSAVFAFSTLSSGNGQFDVLIHRDCDLLFVATVDAEVAGVGATWSRPDPIGWRDTSDMPRHQRTRPFRRFARMRSMDGAMSRSACIAVQRAHSHGPDHYLLTVLVRTAELPLRAIFSRAELDSHWLRIRGILDRLRRDPLMLDGGFDAAGNYTGLYARGVHRGGNQPGSSTGQPDPPAISQERIDAWFNDYLRDLALAGVAARSALFRDPAHQSVYDIIRRHAGTDGSVVQIWLDQDALDFVYPWHWLYDGPLDPYYREGQRAIPQNFWGYRMVIEQVAECTDATCRLPSSAQTGAPTPVRVRVGAYPFKETAAHLTTIERLLADHTDQLDFKLWHESKEWHSFLRGCDANLVYFFAHGHTALPNTSTGVELLRLANEVRNALSIAVTEAKTKTAPRDSKMPRWLHHLVASSLNVIRMGRVSNGPGLPATSSTGTRAPNEQTPATHEALARLLEAFVDLDKDKLWHDHHIRLARGHLKMEDLRSLEILGPSAPLVVLNMCESAQVFPSLTDGLVNVFLRRGALGVVGTEVSMPPHFAAVVGRMLLEGLAEGRTIGPLLFEIRRKFMDSRNLLGFAYTHYGDASAQVFPIPTKVETRERVSNGDV